MNKYDEYENRRRKYMKRKALHQCVQCGAIDERTLSGMIVCMTCAERFRVNAGKTRQRCIEEHRCTKCGCQDERTLSGKHLCEWCLKKNRLSRQRNRQTARNLYNERKAKGLCTRCGEPRDNETLWCSTCREKHRKAMQRRKDESND